MSLWLVIPTRGLATGKSRLAAVLGANERIGLNTQWLDALLTAFAAIAGGLNHCIVVSPSDDALAHAAGRGAQALREAGPGDLNAALEQGCEHARKRGADRILILAADLPVVQHTALLRLIEGGEADAVTLIADKTGTGTNGILLPAAAARGFAFGEASLARHAQRFGAAGQPVRLWRDAGLALDIDTPADLSIWQRRA
jgi:2-phospho-L-lactate guanylyltransferase